MMLNHIDTDKSIVGVCWTPIRSIRPFYANPKFGNTLRDFVQIM